MSSNRGKFILAIAPLNTFPMSRSRNQFVKVDRAEMVNGFIADGADGHDRANWVKQSPQESKHGTRSKMGFKGRDRLSTQIDRQSAINSSLVVIRAQNPQTIRLRIHLRKTRSRDLGALCKTQQHPKRIALVSHSTNPRQILY